MSTNLNFKNILLVDQTAVPDNLDQALILAGGILKRISVSDLGSAILGNIPVRLTAIENSVGSGPGASVWPVARTLTLTGTVNGNVTFDGSANINLSTTVPDGGLTIAKVSTLASTLVGLRNDVNTNIADIGLLKPYQILTGDVVDTALVYSNFSGNGLTQQPPGNNFTYLAGLYHPSGGNYNASIIAISTSNPADSFIGLATGPASMGRTVSWNRVWNEANLDPSTLAPKLNATFTGTLTSTGATQLNTLSVSGSTTLNADIAFKNGGYFYKGTNRILDVTVNDDTASGSGYLINFGQFSAIPNVKIHFTVPGHILRIGYGTGMDYNGNQIWHAGNFNPSTKLNTGSPAVSADKLTNSFSLSLIGTVTGAVSMDGSGNVTLTTSIANAALNFNQVSGLQNALNAKFDKSGGSFLGDISVNNAPVHYNGYTGVMILGSNASPFISQISQNSLNGNWNDPTDNAEFWINRRGHQDTLDHYRTFKVGDGKGTALATFNGQEKSVVISGELRTEGVGSAVIFSDRVTDRRFGLYATSDVAYLWNGAANVGRWDVSGNYRCPSITVTNPDGLRLVYGSYGTFWRNDGADLYLLLTNSGDQYGTWNALRPLRINLSSGSVYSDSSWTVSNSFGATRIWSGWDSGVSGSISCSNWFRTLGQTGIYFADYGGGWHMTDNTYIRAFNDKQVAANDFLITSDLRKKTNIRPFEYRGRLKPLSYSLIESELRPAIGFGAQDVIELYPEAVAYDSSKDTYQLRYGALIAVVAHQINGLEDEVSLLKRRINYLETELDNGNARLDAIEKRLLLLEKS